VVDGAISLYARARPDPLRPGRRLPPASEVPVTIRFAKPPSRVELARLRALGAAIELRRDGSPRGGARTVAADVPAHAVAAIAAIPGVVRVSLDGQILPAPRPLDGTTAEVQAVDVWRTKTAEGVSLTGAGVTVCDLDSGIDVFHPLFFRADGGYYDWVDVDEDGKLTPGVDGIDLDGDGTFEALQVLNIPIVSYFDPEEPLFDSNDPAFAKGLDYLYVDSNNNGVRDLGRDGGFDDATAAFGEPLFVVDDVDGSGVIERGEKLVRLGSSKIRAVRRDSKTFRRGAGLVDAPRDVNSSHGTGAASVMAGGQRGFGKLVGVAPDAEIVMTIDTRGDRQVRMTDFCVDEGARVVLHEYAPWMGYHLDGSSDLEELIDETVAEGVVHINPAGNLSTSKKLFKRTVPAGQGTTIDVDVPDWAPFGFFGTSVLWRDTSRDLTLRLEDPDGASKVLDLSETTYEDWASTGLSIYADRIDSSRGTARVDLYLFPTNEGGPPVTKGRWKIHVGDPVAAGGAGLTLIAYVQDEVSSWGEGIAFPEDVSEDHLIGWPGTADHGLAIAAYTGHGFFGGTPGERAYYSGRGHRIDGEAILSISAPDDPIVGDFVTEWPVSYSVYGGTSGASPHVAGAAALLIQADPTRDGDDVRAKIREGALVDAQVGEAPNDDYGYGKLRIYRSLYGSDPPGGAAPSLDVPRKAVLVGTDATVDVTATDPDEPATGLVLELDREYDGTYEERLETPSFQVRYDTLGTRYLKVRATDATGRTAMALAAVDVVDELPEPPDTTVDDLGPSVSPAGGGCAAAGAPSRGLGGGLAMLLGVVGALLARRRSRP
jgi:subtilisin family serine protease